MKHVCSNTERLLKLGSLVTCFIISSYYFRDPLHRGSDELFVLSLICGSSDVEDEFPDRTALENTITCRLAVTV